MLNIAYTRSTPEPAALSLRVTVVGKFIIAFGCGSKMLPLRGINCLIPKQKNSWFPKSFNIKILIFLFNY